MELSTARRQVNTTRYIKGQNNGHYESFFLRANHPSKPCAFWIRYTIFSPHNEPGKAIGELWAVYFDGEKGNHRAAKLELPFTECDFSNTEFSARVGSATLNANRLRGSIDGKKHKLSWDLKYSGDSAPLFDFPLSYYEKGFPKAKALVSLPLASFSGTLTVDGAKISIKNWIGSQNHNWGSKHTDYYAWGQVAGFNDNPDSFLELATAKVKIGPLWTPFITPLVLRHGGKEYALNGIMGAFRRGTFSYFDWDFRAASKEIAIEGNIHADKKDFVCLPYYNPPGGTKFCLNTKIASCHLSITHRGSGRTEALETPHRAAFEILTDANDHGLTPDV